MQQQPVTFGRRGVGASPQRVTPAAAPRIEPKPTVKVAAAPADKAHDGVLARLPLVTGGLLLILALVFTAEQSASLEAPLALSPGYRSLIALGGVNARLVLHDGQVWRLFTAAWLHAGAAHIVGNGLILLMTGLWLEHLLGRAWFAGVYALSAVGGSAASVLMNPSGPVSVGASGAIMGLLGAALVCSFHVAAHQNKGKMRYWTLRLMIPALVPSSGHIDYSGHFGGVLTGVAVGYLLQFVWPEMQARPNRGGVAAAVAGAWALASAASFGLVALNYSAYAQRNLGLIPDAEIPRGKLAADRWPELNSRYPRDPMGALMTALADESKGDHRDAEALLRGGLAETDVLDNDMPPAVRPMMQASLALVLMQDGRTGDAKDAAAPVCQAPASGAELQRMVKVLRAKGLCG